MKLISNQKKKQKQEINKRNKVPKKINSTILLLSYENNPPV